MQFNSILLPLHDLSLFYFNHKNSLRCDLIIVTGANGFIGSAMVWELNQRGHDAVVCVDSVAIADRPENLKKRYFEKFLLKDELWDFLNSPDAVQKVQWIIHMGANSSTTETNWEHLYENNTLYTQRIFEWCARHNKKMIYASSAATYGAGELGYDDETDPEQLNALNLYGKSKLIFDQWALRQSQVPKKWYGVKFFNVYGPNEYHKGPMASVAFKAFHQIKETGSLKLFKSYVAQFKDGEQKRDFVYVKDVTRWMAEMLDKTPASGIYNMGFGKARTWLDMANALFQSLELPKKVEFIEMPENIRDQYQYFTEARMDKLKKNMPSHPRWSLEDGIRDYVQNYLSKNDPYL